MRNGKRAKFDVITAWEVLEHIGEDQLERFFGNVRDHLAPGGVFCASVATFDCADPNTGAVYHVTVKPRSWWLERVASLGFREAPGLFDTGDFARGSGNGLPSFDWDADERPELGFHLVLKSAS
jgi:SAM-dependent methyltransferase